MIQVKGVVKDFSSGDVVTNVLRGVDLEIPTGQFLSIVGPSGAGKSTLLYQMSLLDRPTRGEILIDGTAVSGFDEGEATEFRLENFGFIFQDYALIPEFTAIENVILPSLMMGVGYETAKRDAEAIFESVGMGGKLSNLPSQLSGGEQQRTSIIRAVAKRPKVLFADEPTASLDSVASVQVMRLLLELNAKGQTIVMVTHEEEYARMAERVVTVKDGRIVGDAMLR